MTNFLRNRYFLAAFVLLATIGNLHAAIITGGKAMGVSSTSSSHSIESATDNDLTTYFKAGAASFGWVGVDLGSQYVIKQLSFCCPTGYSSKMHLGIFEGANKADFSDAIPIYMIKDAPAEGKLMQKTVKCSLGFRYVRYVGPHDSHSVIGEMRLYGTPGEGDSTQLWQLTNLPLINIHTETGGDIVSRTTYVAGVMSIISEDGSKFYTDSLDVRGRGNGSWTFDQKPYKMKLRHKKKLLDMPAKAKKWTLINCVRDKSMIRNIVAYDASRLFGMAFTPAARMVEVILNGEYKGIFQLTDQVEVKKNRVEVTEMTPEDKTEPNISGGYLLEIDAAGGEACMFYSGRYGTNITIHYPKDDEIIPAQKDYIRQFYNDFEKRPFSVNPLNEVKGIPGRLDTESFFRRFLLGEFTANTDDWYSVYFYKERNDDQFHFGPIWDIDLGFENDTRTYPVNNISTYLFQSGKNSIAAGMQNLVTQIISQKSYQTRLKEIWSEVRNEKGLTPEHFEHVVDSLIDYLSEAQALHFTRWPVLNTYLALNIAARGSHVAEAEFVKKFIGNRIKWMDRKVGLYPTLVNKVFGEGSINGGKGVIYLEGFPVNSHLQISSVAGMVIEDSDLQNDERKVYVRPGVYAVKVTIPNGETASKTILVE